MHLPVIMQSSQGKSHLLTGDKYGRRFCQIKMLLFGLFATDILSIIRQYAKTDKCPLNHCNFRLQIRSFANNLRNLSSKANLPNVWKWLFE